MQDLTLSSSRSGSYKYDANLTEEQTICCIPHCNRVRADLVSIHLCAKHIEKAWAAHQIITGQVAFPKEEPEESRDTQSLAAKGTIYFVRIGDLLKIGWTSKPAERMRALQPDAILHYQAGTRRDEAKMHARFIDHLVKGREWFSINDESMDLIKGIQYNRVA